MIILNIKNYGEVKIELDYNNAPNTCANFVDLVKKGFYDGLTFHRIIKGFMIQGGDPLGNGTGGPDFCIPGEFSINHHINKLSHQRGVISMARAMDPDSAGSQFFICDANDDFLDGQYASFGKVISGMEVIDKVASVRTDANDAPYDKVVIESIKAIDEPDNKVVRL